MKTLLLLFRIFLFATASAFVLTCFVTCEAPDGDSGFPLRSMIVEGDTVCGSPERIIFNYLFWFVIVGVVTLGGVFGARIWKGMIIVGYLLLGVLAVFRGHTKEFQELSVWTTVMENPDWRIKEANLDSNNGVLCKLVSGTKILVLVGEELREDRPARLKAKLYDGPEAVENLVGETTVEENARLEKFLNGVIEREIRMLHKARLDMLFQYQAMRRIFLLLKSRDLTFLNERERIEEFEKEYPEY
jgi:hypothetical protein